mmetsp:Transcript_98398/g.225984  ORF Transcript_98398/g.225984 Transcript_98398/m.225984 type:complete len:697 (+) Transcript_98398:3322-5412(+)
MPREALCPFCGRSLAKDPPPHGTTQCRSLHRVGSPAGQRQPGSGVLIPFPILVPGAQWVDVDAEERLQIVTGWRHDREVADRLYEQNQVLEDRLRTLQRELDVAVVAREQAELALQVMQAETASQSAALAASSSARWDAMVSGLDGLVRRQHRAGCLSAVITSWALLSRSSRETKVAERSQSASTALFFAQQLAAQDEKIWLRLAWQGWQRQAESARRGATEQRALRRAVLGWTRGNARTLLMVTVQEWRAVVSEKLAAARIDAEREFLAKRLAELESEHNDKYDALSSEQKAALNRLREKNAKRSLAWLAEAAASQLQYSFASWKFWMQDEKRSHAQECERQASEKLRKKYVDGLGKIGSQLLTGGRALDLRFKFDAWKEVCRSSAAGKAGEAYREAMEQADLRISTAATESLSAVGQARAEAARAAAAAASDHKKHVERLTAKMIAAMAADAVHVTLTLTFGGWRQAFRAKYLNAGRAAVSFAAAHKGWSFVTLIEFFGQWKGLWSSSSERAKLADDHFSMACLVRQFHFWREATQHGLQPSRATVSHELPRIYERELQRDSHQRRALEQRLVEMQREVDVLRAGQRTSQELARPDVLPPPAEVLGLGRRAKSAHHFFVSFFARIMLGYPLGSEVRAECRAWLVYGLWIMMLSTFLGCILSAVQYISAAAQSRSLPCSTPIRFWFLVSAVSMLI